MACVKEILCKAVAVALLVVLVTVATGCSGRPEESVAAKPPRTPAPKLRGNPPIVARIGASGTEAQRSASQITMEVDLLKKMQSTEQVGHVGAKQTYEQMVRTCANTNTDQNFKIPSPLNSWFSDQDSDDEVTTEKMFAICKSALEMFDNPGLADKKARELEPAELQRASHESESKRRIDETTPPAALEPPQTEVTKEDCCICLEHMEGSDVATLPCNHKFHKDCITKWENERVQASEDPTCPVCRHKIQMDADGNFKEPGAHGAAGLAEDPDVPCYKKDGVVGGLIGGAFVGLKPAGIPVACVVGGGAGCGAYVATAVGATLLGGLIGCGVDKCKETC